MGKRRRLNKFISKWIKSDLPEDRSTVLLLGVTRIPTTPLLTRRPCSLPPAPTDPRPPPETDPRRRHDSSRRGAVVVRRHSSRRSDGRRHCPYQAPTVTVSAPPPPSERWCAGDASAVAAPAANRVVSRNDDHDDDAAVASAAMERSVDSIGTCSLDVEASAELSDWSEVSSVGTLRSATIATPTPEPHLPSYLSLACTVNGYSTTTNYDPIRLARSRDASPHRIDSDLTAAKATYSVQNNLLSPPNLVPLPTRSQPRTSSPAKMGENTLAQHHHQDFYSSTKTMSFMSKESRFTSNLFATKDSIDGCLENGHHTIHSKCVSFESKNITSINGQSKCTSETSIRQEYSNGNETKSFIQQRVERLYGPGALAQGFFVTKRQKNRSSDSEERNTSMESDKHSKSLSEKFLEDDLEPTMKQSTSSPTLPVLRHLRPEFRAQLPIISLRKGVEGSMQKSVTVPKLKDDEVKVNGHSKADEEAAKIATLKDSTNEPSSSECKEKAGERDGHYFLRILEEQANRLLELAARVESEISTPNLSEEVIGKLRSAAGKARLLVSQKMQQFKGLCTNNINQSVGEAFPTTNEDLQGFWDMVMLQVHQVDALFKEIDALRNNDWKELAKVSSKLNVNGTTKVKKVSRPRPTNTANEEARKQREAERRKMIEERRKAMKAQQSKPRESIEIFVPESS